MRRILTAILGLVAITAVAQVRPKLSPLTREFLFQVEKQPGVLPANYVYRRLADGKVYVCALIQVSDQAEPGDIGRIGGRIGTRAGDIWTVMTPVDKVGELAGLPGISYIQLDEPVHGTLDSARRQTRVDSVHAGQGSLPNPFHGDNVVVGIIDAGFDYTHPTLWDTTGSHYRVKRVWEQLGSGAPPSGYSYGKEITDSSQMWTEGTDGYLSHGAHVSGIAAGSGYGSPGNDRFRGVADAADLVLVGITPAASDWTTTGMSSIIDGMSYIFNYAASVGKPAVANLSWGCSIGPHDGLSLFSRACDNLTGPGRIFVCSAGNNGDQSLHLQKSFTAADTVVKTMINFNTGLPDKRNWVDIWGDSSQIFCVQLTLTNGSAKIDSTGFICLDNQLHQLVLKGSNNDTLFASVSTSVADFNGKPRVFIDLYSRVPDGLMLTVKSTNGKINAWNGYVLGSTGYYTDFTPNGSLGAVGGNTAMTISDMASTKSALAVGAYNSKTVFTNVSGSVVSYNVYAQYGRRAPFSSLGPTEDGRVKPDITAPGLILGSAINHFDTSFSVGGTNYGSVVYKWQNPQNSREYSYAMLMGTSMSSPMAAGIVALMLQANPSMNPGEVQAALAATAIRDSYTGNIPAAGNNSWGHGKINAMGAVLQAIQLTGVDGGPSAVANNLLVYPNPSTGITFLQVNAAGRSDARMEVLDLNGRKLMDQPLQLQGGINEVPLKTKGWAAGTYLIRVTDRHASRCAKLVVY